MRRILLIGEDYALMETRALLLSSWKTSISSSRDALDVMRQEKFDLIIIGQLVNFLKAADLIKEARAQAPPPKVLAIRFPGDPDSLGVETHILNSPDKPSWLIDKVVKMIGVR